MRDESHLGIPDGEPKVLKEHARGPASLPIIDGNQQLWLLFLLGGQDDTSTSNSAVSSSSSCFKRSRSLEEVSSSRMWLQSYCTGAQALPLTGGHPGLGGALALDPSGSALVFSFSSTTASRPVSFSGRRKPGFLSSRFTSGASDRQHVQLPLG